jgi:hypothetical protein
MRLTVHTHKINQPIPSFSEQLETLTNIASHYHSTPVVNYLFNMSATFPNSESAEHIMMQDVDHSSHADAMSICSNESDGASESATLNYEREPYEAFQPKVLSIALQKLHPEALEITIEQMKGGSFNRVGGITISPKPKKFNFNWFKSHCLGARRKTAASKYIVRIPCAEVLGDDPEASMREDMEQEVAIL